MKFPTFIILFAVWLTVIGSLCCAVYMVSLIRERYNRRERGIQLAALFFFLFYAGIFIGRILYEWFPVVSAAAKPLLYACHTCIGPTFYYIVFRMTSGGRPQRFARIHFIAPLVLPAVLALWMPFVPFEVPVGIVEGMRELNPRWPLFSQLFASVMAAEFAFIALYLTLSVLRLRRYRRSLPRSKQNNARDRLRWLNAMIVCVLLAPTHPVFLALLPLKDPWLTSGILFLCAVLVITMELILLYDIQQHNYPTLDIKPKRNSPVPKKTSWDIPEESAPPQVHRTDVKHFSQKELDAYFRKHKPYLDPQVKLTTLAPELGLTREELSKFINRTYGVNFNVFIGRWRLRELEALRKLKKNRDVPVKQLLGQAGFSYYNSYLRARRESEGVTPQPMTPDKPE